MRPFTSSCFFLHLLRRLFLLALPFLLGTLLFSPWSPTFPPRALAHLDSFLPYDLVLWTDGSVPSPLGKGDSGVLANCLLCGTEVTLFFSVGSVCSSFSAKACAILRALCWSRQHQQVCYFSSFLLPDSRSVLTTLFSPPSFLLPQSLWQKLSSLSS